MEDVSVSSHVHMKTLYATCHHDTMRVSSACAHEGVLGCQQTARQRGSMIAIDCELARQKGKTVRFNVGGTVAHHASVAG